MEGTAAGWGWAVGRGSGRGGELDRASVGCFFRGGYLYVPFKITR